jgi:uncharacterized membrane protein
LTHNGVDIVDYVLYTVYPTAAFFAVGLVAKKTGMRQLYTYVIQAAICIAFSVAYFILVPLGGAQGIAVILAMFGTLLLYMARKEKLRAEQKSA